MTFPVTWDVPANGLQMQSFSTARCGDTVVIKCPPGVRNGVYRITNRELLFVSGRVCVWQKGGAQRARAPRVVEH